MRHSMLVQQPMSALYPPALQVVTPLAPRPDCGVGYLPVATATDIIKWLKAEELPPSELPNRLDFPSELYQLGARPLSPGAQRSEEGEPDHGPALSRIARVWTDQSRVEWNIEGIAASRLAKLHSNRQMPGAELKVGR